MGHELFAMCCTYYYSYFVGQHQCGKRGSRLVCRHLSIFLNRDRFHAKWQRPVTDTEELSVEKLQRNDWQLQF